MRLIDDVFSAEPTTGPASTAPVKDADDWSDLRGPSSTTPATGTPDPPLVEDADDWSDLRGASSTTPATGTPDPRPVEDAEIITQYLRSLDGVPALEAVRTLTKGAGTVITWDDNGRGFGGGIPTRPASGSVPDKEAVRQAMTRTIKRLQAAGYEIAGTEITTIARAAKVECSRSHPDIRAERGPLAPGMAPLRRMR